MAAELTIGELPVFSGTLSGNYLIEIEVPATSAISASGYSITYSALFPTVSLDSLSFLDSSSISPTDKFIIRDTSDTTDGASGTDKWIYVSGVSGLQGASGATGATGPTGPAGPAGSGVGDFTYVYKTVDEARSSTTTMSADSQLYFTASSGYTYCVTAKLFLHNADPVMDAKIHPAFLGGGTSGTLSVWRGHTTADGTSFGGFCMSAFSGTTTIFNGSAGIFYYTLESVFSVSSTGTFAIQWAQNTSNASNLTMLKGSRLQYSTPIQP